MQSAQDQSPIRVQALVKRYGDLVAVNGVDLEATAGTCLGLLGPNGAGKTTTIEILEGLLTPDAGEIRILGRRWDQDADAIRELIGVQLQDTKFPEKLTVLEILALFRSFYGKGRDPRSVLALVGLEEKRSAKTITLSGGQLQRLALGCALVSEPRVLFLDEPTTGLDPQARRRVWEIIEEFKADGGTVLLTTHYMDEAERLADDLVIMDHGKVIARGSPASIIDSLGVESIVSFAVEGAVGDMALQSLPGVLSVREAGDRTELTVAEARETLPALLDRVREAGSRISELNTHRPTLEDVFVTLTGRHLRDD